MTCELGGFQRTQFFAKEGVFLIQCLLERILRLALSFLLLDLHLLFRALYLPVALLRMQYLLESLHIFLQSIQLQLLRIDQIASFVMADIVALEEGQLVRAQIFLEFDLLKLYRTANEGWPAAI